MDFNFFYGKLVISFIENIFEIKTKNQDIFFHNNDKGTGPELPTIENL